MTQSIRLRLNHVAIVVICAALLGYDSWKRRRYAKAVERRIKKAHPPSSRPE